MSDEERGGDWIANHDQIRAQVEEVMNKRCAFALVYYEDDDHPDYARTLAFFRDGDEERMLAALAFRFLTEDGQKGMNMIAPRPEDAE